MIDRVTGLATAVGPSFGALNGTAVGLDCNPTVDRIRVVSNAGQNLRLHPDTGVLAATDGTLTPAGSVSGAAYTNNRAGATTTMLFDIDTERAMYWPGSSAQWFESHASFGVTMLGQRWAFGEGRVGGPSNYATFVLLANPGTVDATSTVTYLRANSATVLRTVTVPRQSRLNIWVNVDIPESANESFGVSSLDDGDLRRAGDVLGRRVGAVRCR